MSNQLFNLNDKFALVAKTKSGKSYLGKMIQKAYPRKIIIDSTYEYTDQDGLIVYGFKDFASAIAHVADLDQYTIIFRFNHEEKNDEEIFEQICRLVFYLGDTFFVIEEIHLHATAHQMNRWLLKIATTGSHQGIGYLLTTQRPSLIHKTLLTQCDHVFIGALIDAADIQYVKGFCGEKARTLPTYPARKFIYWTHGQTSEISSENLTNKL